MLYSTYSIFKENMGQTSDSPMSFMASSAHGIYIYNEEDRPFIDLIAGVSVSNVGHCHPKVVEAVEIQASNYMHLMVYGEYVLRPQVLYTKQLLDLLPDFYDNIYYVNSGSEATEAALKLAKRYTGRTEIIAFRNAYHGSTHGALSVLGNEYFKNSFRPLLPDVKFIEFNNEEDLQQITERTACVIAEPIQAEAGIILPENDFLKKLRKRCDETGTLLIFDEVQTGFGRTGELFAFMKYDVRPDIFTIAKAMGGGMPIGGVVSNRNIMQVFKTNPELGHITTFGGHPVSAAAAKAALEVLTEGNLIQKVEEKGKIFKENLTHYKIKSVHGTGLFLAVELESPEKVKKFVKKGLNLGYITDWFIFNPKFFRIAPPLTITKDQIYEAIELINSGLNNIK